MGLSGCVVDSVCGSLKVYHDHYHGDKVSFNTLGDRFIPKCIRPGGNDNMQCHHKQYYYTVRYLMWVAKHLLYQSDKQPSML